MPPGKAKVALSAMALVVAGAVLGWVLTRTHEGAPRAVALTPAASSPAPVPSAPPAPSPYQALRDLLGQGPTGDLHEPADTRTVLWTEFTFDSGADRIANVWRALALPAGRHPGQRAGYPGQH
jgi:hypothetical protein